MSDTTTLIALIATLVVLAGGVAVGSTGPLATGTADVAEQETAQNVAQETTTQNGTAQETAQNGTAQATAQAGGAQDSTNVTARNVTIDTLVLRNATVLDANIGELTVVNTSGENATNRTYEGVSVRRIEASGTVTDLTLENVSINNESLATALLNESGRLRLDTRLVMDLAVLQNQTVNGLEIEQATVRASAARNVSVGAQVGAGGQSGNGTASEGQPAISAESVVVEGANLTRLNVTGVSTGAETAQTNQTATETTQTTQTTAAANGTAQTTGAEETTETSTIPAEARSGATDEGTTTTETN
ncbi:hypothetical protein M0R89_13905 [Halorussus limi]|uniref:Uncharacterized protein n=1 Tax=Halorussus limi TaxID=2938695 RepID=A0A8U0HRY5_9EURY|nr:hypothetical protein [Halorussus limi]UPV73628.1 hypothetical protein M0R89_13905 [Halorussus limi]